MEEVEQNRRLESRLGYSNKRKLWLLACAKIQFFSCVHSLFDLDLTRFQATDPQKMPSTSSWRGSNGTRSPSSTRRSGCSSYIQHRTFFHTEPRKELNYWCSQMHFCTILTFSGTETRPDHILSFIANHHTAQMGFGEPFPCARCFPSCWSNSPTDVGNQEESKQVSYRSPHCLMEELPIQL